MTFPNHHYVSSLLIGTKEVFHVIWCIKKGDAFHKTGLLVKGIVLIRT